MTKSRNRRIRGIGVVNAETADSAILAAETAVSAFSISVPYRNADFADSAFLRHKMSHQ